MKSCNNTTSLVLRKDAWTPEEDMLLKDCIQKFGEGKWHLVPQRAGLNRCRKSCRLRWLNYLKPSIKRGHFEEDEVDLLRRLHKLLGNRWSLIAGRLPGRTANDVKNYWNRCRPKQKKEELKDGEPVVTIVKPIPCTLSKSLNLQITYNENRNLITSSNGGIGNASVSDDRINEYLTDDHEKEADVEVGWSFPDDEGLRINVDQEDGQISLFDFSIEKVDIWDLITSEQL